MNGIGSEMDLVEIWASGHITGKVGSKLITSET